MGSSPQKCPASLPGLILFLCVTRLFLRAAFCPGLWIDTRNMADWIGISPETPTQLCYYLSTLWLSFPRRRESPPAKKMDTRLRGYDIVSGRLNMY